MRSRAFLDMRSRAFLALVVPLALGAAAAAGPLPAPVLEVPVDCEIGVLCVVQNYVDQDPGPGAKDHTCGPLSYDGHKGVDIRLPGIPEMLAGVAVRAAAPGVVKAVRDGVADVSMRKIDPESIAGREAGNAVVIDHGGGWESQYSHMRRGSIAVRKGARVETGARLGLIGLSGRTEFPHLHFAVRRNGRAIDPYSGLPPGSGCDREAAPLWSAAAQAALAYRAGGLLAAGFAIEAPTLERVLEGAYREARLPAGAPALVFWAASWGLRGGDRESLRILGPDGRTLVEKTGRLPRNKAQWLRYAGRKRAGQAFPPGRYRGHYRLTREVEGRTVVVVDVTRTAELR